MINIKYDSWDFNVDIDTTMEYYKEYEDRCSCAMCRNFYMNAANLQSDVREFLEQFGIDVSKPIEQWSITADKQKNLVENVLYYAVNGTAKSMYGYEINFDTIPIVVQAPKPDDVVQSPEHAPNTEIKQPYFIFEVFNVWTPWTVNDDMSKCYPELKPKLSFWKKLGSRFH